MPRNKLVQGLDFAIHLLKPGLGLAAFVGGYVVILWWFKEVDVYHKEFSTPGILTAIYNLSRVIFIFYLFWIVYQVGNCLLACVAWRSLKTVAGIDRLAMGFFAGTGVCHAVLLLLGYLDLYKVSIAIGVTLPLVAFAYRDAAASFNAARVALGGWYAHRDTQSLLFAFAFATAMAAASALLLVKGLYPAGGHDYYLHYFEYYKSVIDNGGIWPTRYYTHGYDSKGDGLVFLSMLLTDAIAHQLVTYCFIIVGALALHQLLNRIAPATLWPLVGVTLYLAVYIYTPGTGIYLANGGWGDFEKWHEFTTALTIAVIWLVSGAFDDVGEARSLKIVAAASAVIAAVIIDYTFAIYLGLLLTLLALIYFAMRQWRFGWTCVALASVAGATLTIMIATNYLTTGLMGDIAITAWWRFTNVERLYRTGLLLQAINDYWSRISLSPSYSVLSTDTLKLIYLSLRLELLYPLLASGIAAALIAVAIGRSSRLPRHQAVVLGGAALAYLIFALVLGRNGDQQISFYRYSSFTLPVTIATGVALWSTAGIARSNLFRFALHCAPLAVLAGCSDAAFAAYPPGHFSGILRHAESFAVGKWSIDRAYTDQTLWPGRMPYGAIYPGARGAYAVVGPHAHVWSFNLHAYCMLPDCDFDAFFYGTMTGKDERVFFGTAEEAKRALRDAGVNYFLISSELPPEDPVLRSALFAPDNIAKYLGLRWTDGTTSLLTWLGPDTTPLSQTWLAGYCREVARTGAFYYGAMRRIFADLHKRPHPWGRLDLPLLGNGPFSQARNDAVAIPQYSCPPFPVEIISATYGQSCRQGNPKQPAGNSIPGGNVTALVRKACLETAGKTDKCTFVIDSAGWKDPAPGCDKDFSVAYRCGPTERPRTAIVAPPAAGETVRLDCSAPGPSGLMIHAATYGGNCGAKPINVTRALASKCDGKTECTYSIDGAEVRSATPTCNNDLVASYTCAPDDTILHEDVPFKTGSDAIASLSCLRDPPYNAASLPQVKAGQILDFANGQSRNALLGAWSAPESDGVWTLANAAYIGFVVQGSDAPRQAILHVAPFTLTDKLENQRLQVWSAGTELAEFNLTGPAPTDLKIPLDRAEVTAGSPLILGLYLPDARPLNEIMLGGDRRILGVHLISLKLTP